VNIENSAVNGGIEHMIQTKQKSDIKARTTPVLGRGATFSAERTPETRRSVQPRKKQCD
jgi:hypothetical protein